MQQQKNGARVILAEDKPRYGGSLLTSDVNIGNQTGAEWSEKIITELKSMSNVIVKNRSQVFGYYDHNVGNVGTNKRSLTQNPKVFT
jgi:sarcosine oxidase subunit alpha